MTRNDPSESEIRGAVFQRHGIGVIEDGSEYTIHSTSQPGVEYTIKYCGTGDGDPDCMAIWSCSCPAQTTCRHLRAFWAADEEANIAWENRYDTK